MSLLYETEDDPDRIVTVTDMIVGAYAIANASPVLGGAEKIIVTVVQDIEDDTEGTIDIVGTDIYDGALTETITPLIGSTVTGTREFKTVTSVTGVGWVSGGTADDITVGYAGSVLLSEAGVVLELEGVPFIAGEICIVITSERPEIVFVGEKPEVAFAGERPEVEFTTGACT